MEIYGVDGVLYADNRNDLHIRMSKGYDGYNEDFILKPFDLSSLKII